MKPNLQHAIERVERPGGSHEGVGRKKNSSTGVLVMLCKQVTRVDRPIQGELSRDDERVAVKVACPGSPSQ